MSRVYHFAQRFEPKRPLLQFGQVFLEFDLLVQEPRLFGEKLVFVDQARQMRVQQFVEFFADFIFIIFDFFFLRGDFTVGALAILGQPPAHDVKALRGQSDRDQKLVDLFGERFFARVAFPARPLLFCAAIIMKTFLSLGRDGAPARGALGEAQIGKNMLHFFRSRHLSHDFLDAIESFFGDQRFVRPLVGLTLVNHEAVIERSFEGALDFGFDERLVLAAHQAPLEGSFLQFGKCVTSRGVSFKKLTHEGRVHFVGNHFARILVVDVTERRPTRPLAATDFLTLAAPHVLGQVVDVIFGLAEGDVQHEFALGRVLEPEGGKFQKLEVVGVEEINEPAAVDGISGEAIGMPRNNSVRLAFFDLRNHLVEDRAAGNLGALRLGESLHDVQALTFGKGFKFRQLRFNRERLTLFGLGRFARIEKKVRIHFAPREMIFESDKRDGFVKRGNGKTSLLYDDPRNGNPFRLRPVALIKTETRPDESGPGTFAERDGCGALRMPKGMRSALRRFILGCGQNDPSNHFVHNARL